MIVTTTFATWFGSETVLGIPAKFVSRAAWAVWWKTLSVPAPA
jgi:SSS family solute:Na+ symporter